MAKPPNGKRVLNTHISEEEYNFLKEMAEKNSMTITMYLRNLVRSEMTRAKEKSLNSVFENFIDSDARHQERSMVIDYSKDSN